MHAKEGPLLCAGSSTNFASERAALQEVRYQTRAISVTKHGRMRRVRIHRIPSSAAAQTEAAAPQRQTATIRCTGADKPSSKSGKAVPGVETADLGQELGKGVEGAVG